MTGVGKLFTGIKGAKMWILLILAVHINNPQDIPARVTIEFETQQDCEQAKNSTVGWTKFDTFKIITECQKKS
jgi:hypothetical protein